MDARTNQYSMGDLFRSLSANHGSDLHLSAGSPPRIRINGTLRPLDLPALTPDETKRLVYSVLTQEQKAKVEWDKELNTALGVSGIGRFRVNVFFQRSSMGAVFRNIPHDVPNFKQLHLPVRLFDELCALPKGLVIIVGPAGAGKSTTLAAMIDCINNREECHIVTVEEPLEFLHKNSRSLVNQREVGHDSHSFSAALKNAVRQDPDIIAIADIGDRETLELALSLCETGHLVFATIAVADVAQAMQFLIGLFPAEQQEMFLVRLAGVLETIIAQQLVARADEEGLLPGLEICIANATVRSILRDNKMSQLYAAMQTGVRDGMSTMNNSLAHFVSVGMVTRETAMQHTTRSEEMKELLDMLNIQQDGRKNRTSTRIW